MSFILIEPGFARGYRRSEEIELLAAAIRDAVIDHSVQVKYVEPLPDTGHPYTGPMFSVARVSIEAISLSINVPWEALTGAVATIFLESVRDWLRDRYRTRYEERQAEAARVNTKSAPRFQLFRRRQEAPVAEAISILPHQVEIFGPRGELIGIVYQDARLSHPKILTGPAAVNHAQHYRFRSARWS